MDEAITRGALENKVTILLNDLENVNPQLKAECEVEYREDGSALVYGPFPSFLILVEAVGPLRAMIHVNADAPNLVYVFSKLNLQVSIDGAFAVDGATGQLILGSDAYSKKEENILMFAKDIMTRRHEQKQEGILVPEKKIIIAS